MIQNIANIARLACSTLAFRPLAAVIAIAVLAAAFALSAPAQAQAQGADGDNDYVDVELILEVPRQDVSNRDRGLNIIVVNHGSTTAYDVEVVVNIAFPEGSSYFLAPGDYDIVGRDLKVPIGRVFQGDDIYSLKWSIPALGRLQRETLSVRVIHEALTRDIVKFDKTQYPHEHYGKVTTSSFESNLHKENNEARVWAYTYDLVSFYHQVAGNYSVALSVDEPSPSPGDTVNFTITTETENPYGGNYSLAPPPIDLEVAIELTRGLSVSGTPTYEPDDKGLSYSDGIFNVGTLKQARDARVNTVTLPITVDSDATVSEQCLKATLTGNPPPGVGPLDDDISDNVAKVCLGTAPAGTRVALSDGTVDLFTWYDCSEATTGPCDSSISLELVARAGRAAAEAGAPYGIFRPGNVVVHIADPSGRANSSDSNSDATVWSTGFQHPGSGSDRTGIILGDDPTHPDIETTEDNDQWGVPDSTNTYQIGDLIVEVTGPGEVSTWYFSGGPTSFYGSGTDETIYEDIWYLGFRYDIWLEFATLGTYTVKQTIKAKYDDDTTDTTDPTEYTDSGTYTFHVGPMADLEVRQGAASSHVAAGQHALTVVASNNGPYHSVGSRVTGLPTGAEVIHVSHGSYNGATGEWNISQLKGRDYYSSAGIPEPSLVLGASAGDTAHVSIASMKNYEVCIDGDGVDLDHDSQTACEADTTNGGSWHSTPVYDYDRSNSTNVPITAQAGTGGVGAEIPGSPEASILGSFVAFRWEAVSPDLYGVPVSHYEAQYRAAGSEDWRPLRSVASTMAEGGPSGATGGPEAGVVQGTAIVDVGIGPGETRYYRVRAVNEASVAGLWTIPVVARTGGAEVAPGAPAGVSASASGGGAIDVSWGPPDDDGGLDVSGYQARWSANGTSGWRNFGVQDKDARSYTHTGLAFGTERYYQVRARNGAGWGSWSSTVSATTAAGVPATPNLTARATDASTIALSWSEPADNTDAIIRYEIERSADGTTWAALTSTAASVRTHDDTGLEPGTTRHYRVRAVNGAGDGSWSTARSATTRVVAPGVPRGLAAAVDGENAIGLSWLAPEDDGGSAVTSYRLELRAVTAAGLGGASNRTVGASGVLEYAHTGLTVGSTWQYRVRARNSAGWGEWSAPVRATTETGVAASPGSFAARANGSSEIVLTWTEPDGRGERVQYYHIDWSADGSADGWSRLATVAADKTTHIDGGLQPGTKRYYRVRGRNFNGAGAWSPTRHATTPANAPGAPTNLMATSTSDKAIDLSWTTPGGAGTAVNGYWVERSRDGSAPWRRVATLGAVTTYTDTRELYPGMKRHYRVAAVNSGGAGPWSNVAHATTTTTTREAAAAPGWVDNLRFTSVGSTSVGLAWSAPPDTGGAPVTGYRYQVTGPSGAREPGVLGSGARSVTITGLNEEGGYVFAVWAVNAVGDGLAEWLTTDLAGR